MPAATNDGEFQARTLRRAHAMKLLGRDDRFPIDPDLGSDDPGQPRRQRPRSIVPAHRRDASLLVAIAAGGFVGTLCRYGVGIAYPPSVGQVPWATLAINTTGSFALGVILTTILERTRPHRLAQPFLCVGLLGGWTTMSTFVLETALLVKDGDAAIALGYVLATVVSGAIATTLGITLARGLTP
jgi:CrcB protein